MLGGEITLESEWEELLRKLIRQDFLKSEKVIRAMRAVPRIKFLPENLKKYAAVDTPLHIGYGQTISAPHS